MVQQRPTGKTGQIWAITTNGAIMVNFLNVLVWNLCNSTNNQLTSSNKFLTKPKSPTQSTESPEILSNLYHPLHSNSSIPSFQSHRSPRSSITTSNNFLNQASIFSLLQHKARTHQQLQFSLRRHPVALNFLSLSRVAASTTGSSNPRTFHRTIVDRSHCVVVCSCVRRKDAFDNTLHGKK